MSRFKGLIKIAYSANSTSPSLEKFKGDTYNAAQKRLDEVTQGGTVGTGMLTNSQIKSMQPSMWADASNREDAMRSFAGTFGTIGRTAWDVTRGISGALGALAGGDKDAALKSLKLLRPDYSDADNFNHPEIFNTGASRFLRGAGALTTDIATLVAGGGAIGGALTKMPKTNAVGRFLSNGGKELQTFAKDPLKPMKTSWNRLAHGANMLERARGVGGLALNTGLPAWGAVDSLATGNSKSFMDSAGMVASPALTMIPLAGQGLTSLADGDYRNAALTGAQIAALPLIGKAGNKLLSAF